MDERPQNEEITLGTDFHLDSLVVDNSQADAEDLIRALRPEIPIAEIKFTNSAHKAVQNHIDHAFNVCFISDRVPAEDLASFFKDIKSLKVDQRCIFVQVKKELSENFNSEPAKSLGFNGVISRQGTYKDKEELYRLTLELFKAKDIEVRKTDVKSAMKVLLRELDSVADFRRRGVTRQFNTLSMDFIADQTEVHQDILDQYFESLESQTTAAPPPEMSSIEIPQHVLKRNLPNLSESNYSGKSERVWKRLIKNFGVKK